MIAFVRAMLKAMQRSCNAYAMQRSSNAYASCRTTALQMQHIYSSINPFAAVLQHVQRLVALFNKASCTYSSRALANEQKA